MINWIIKQFKLLSLLFIHIPTEKEIQERRRKTAEILGIYFYCEKKRQQFIKELKEYDFCKDLPKGND